MQAEGDIAEARANLGRRIRRLREERGWSQYQFAGMLPMDRSYLVGVERGRRNVSFDNIAKIARGLGVSVAELCWGIDAEYAGRGPRQEVGQPGEDERRPV